MEPASPSTVEQVIAGLDALRARTAGIDVEKLETLLCLIEEPDTRVIPVLGQELVLVPSAAGNTAASDTTLHHLLAERLASDLRIAPEKKLSLDEVIASHRPFKSDRKLIYKKLHALMRSPEIASLRTPSPLRQLAAIRDFKLFVSTTWDPFLEQAINEVWYGGQKGAVVRSFSPYTPADLQDGDLDHKDENPPVVFKMFGTTSEDPYYAATDADMIEFLHRLQHDKRPNSLFAELKNSHLLILGTSFPNWMARLFLRIIKDEELWKNREKNEYLADGQLALDTQLVAFINQYSRNTECFPKIGAADFVERLHAEWIARNPERALTGARTAPGARVVRPEECVFISYASEDREKVIPIKEKLAAMGWPVWFDQKDLDSGNLYEETIERTIRSAQACVVILTSTTNGNEPRFFRQEWEFAIRRQRYFTDLPYPFIHPLRLSADAQIPNKLQSFNALDGFEEKGPRSMETFLNDMKSVLRQINKGQAPR